MAPVVDRAILRQLAAAYHSQRLVPFLGAGMRVPTFPVWRDFVRAVEERAGRPPVSHSRLLLERSHLALRKIGWERQEALQEVIIEALGARRALQRCARRSAEGPAARWRELADVGLWFVTVGVVARWQTRAVRS